MLGWRQLQAAVRSWLAQFEQCDGKDVSCGGDGGGVGDGDGGEQHQFCIWWPVTTIAPAASICPGLVLGLRITDTMSEICNDN